MKPALVLLLLCASLLSVSATPPAPAVIAAQDDVHEITLEELRDYKYKQGRRLPKRIQALDGMRVRVTGFMALSTPEGVSEYQLISDSCGCDGLDKPNHFIMVQLGEDTTQFSPDEITVTGTFSVGEEEEDGFVTSLYRIEAELAE